MSGALEIAFLASMYFKCGVGVNPETLHAIVKTESSGRPYVVANVPDKTSHSFNTKMEAIEFVNDLEAQGKTYSAGLMQIYSKNFKAYNVSNETIFDACTNISVGAKILKECFERSKSSSDGMDLSHLEKAFSCYYSGNFTRGFREDDNYVQRVIDNYVSIYEVPSYSDYSDKKTDIRVRNNPSLSEIKQDIKPSSDAWDIFNDFKEKVE